MTLSLKKQIQRLNNKEKSPINSLSCGAFIYYEDKQRQILRIGQVIKQSKQNPKVWNIVTSRLLSRHSMTPVYYHGSSECVHEKRMLRIE